jgi:hypothetical protein
LIAMDTRRGRAFGMIKGNITAREFLNEVALACETWCYLAASVMDYISRHGRKPAMLVVHPRDLAELLMALDSPDAHLPLFEGVAILADVRCARPCLADEAGGRGAL